ncbi:MAG: LytR/AlgR family response regulator transcription factor [Emticicia sp.]|uniref:LytR/AlgR family response regulator transcription factor n=1 Tax=Emticicia sp. TaxID=1930953 RepID=UPI003BA51935
MITCIIIDDEPSAVNLLAKYASDIPYLEVVGTFDNPINAMSFLKQQEVDLIFLDIQMPKLTGMQFLQTSAIKSKVILTTAYSQYAVDSYEHSPVVDYLMKPIPFERFLKGVEKVFNIINKEVDNEKNNTELEFLLLKTEHKGKLQKVEFDQIVYIEGMLNYISIFLTDNSKVVTYIGIGDIEKKIPNNEFIRVHRSYIVSINAIKAIDGNEIILKGFPRIPLGDKFRTLVLERFKKNMLNSK